MENLLFSFYAACLWELVLEWLNLLKPLEEGMWKWLVFLLCGMNDLHGLPVASEVCRVTVHPLLSF